jgi:uncharacterized membrane protein
MSSRHRILRRIPLVAVALGLALVAGPRPQPASAQSAKSFTLSTLDVDATVNPDASMTVKEVVTYFFQGGPFTFATRSFQPQWRDRIEGFTATEGDVPLLVTPPTNSSSGQWQWNYAPVNGGPHTFTLNYRVPGAVSVGSDVGELYWQFIGADHPGLSSMAVHVHFKGEYPVSKPDTPDADTSVVRAWAHGPSNGTVFPSARGVEMKVSAVPAKTFVEGRIVMPLSAFTSPGTALRLPTILREEKGYLDKGQTGGTASKVLAPLVSLLGLLGFGTIWRKHGKEPAKPDFIGDYWREPLVDPPAVITANMSFGSVDGRAMAATLVDLAQRGYLSITEEHVERLGPDKHLYRFTATTPKPRVGQPLPPPPAPWETDLLEQLFQGQSETTSDDFSTWAKSDQQNAAAFWNGWKKSVSTDMRQRGFLETGRAKVWLSAIGIIVATAVTGMVLLAVSVNRAGHSSRWGLLCLGSAAVMLGFLPTLRKRTDVGTERNAQAKALKKYLEDFSNLQDAPVESLILWERFLVYGVALGVASHVMKGLSIRLPNVANNTGFAPWWIPIGGRGNMGPSMDGFPTSWGGEAAKAMTPQNTSSGSGGGFSGGGGGGGGGGGFGAG